jgi:nitric oxide reductase large subunit
MARFLEYIRIYLVSAEALAIGLVYATHYYLPEVGKGVGDLLLGNPTALNGLAAFTLTLASATFGLGMKLHRPLSQSSNRPLYDWPQFWKLRARIVAGCVFSSLGVFASICALVLGKSHSDGLVGSLAFLAAGIPAISAFSMYLAHLSLAEVIEP